MIGSSDASRVSSNAEVEFIKEKNVAELKEICKLAEVMQQRNTSSKRKKKQRNKLPHLVVDLTKS